MPLPIFDEPWRRGGVGLLPYQVELVAPQVQPPPPVPPPPIPTPPVDGSSPGGGGVPGDVADPGDSGPGSLDEYGYTPPDIREAFPGFRFPQPFGQAVNWRGAARGAALGGLFGLPGALAGGLFGGMLNRPTVPTTTRDATTTGSYGIPQGPEPGQDLLGGATTQPRPGGGLNQGYRPGDVEQFTLPDDGAPSLDTITPDQRARDTAYYGRGAVTVAPLGDPFTDYMKGVLASNAASIPAQRQAQTDALINGALGLAQRDLAVAEGEGTQEPDFDWINTAGLPDNHFLLQEEGEDAGWFWDPETDTFYR